MANAAKIFQQAFAAYQAGRREEAAKLYEKVLVVDSGHFGALRNLGVLRFDQGRYEDGIALMLKAVTVDPNNAESHLNLGIALFRLNREEQARPAIERAIALKPDHAAAHNQLGALLKRLGDIEGARRAVERAIELQPNEAGFYHNLADCKRFAVADRHLAAMEALIGKERPLSVGDRIALHFALFKALDDSGERDRAFTHLSEGNALKRRHIIYDETALLSWFERNCEVFTPSFMRSRAGLGNMSRVPVFVVGMMRSGTTLIEQILASHPLIHGAGERFDFSNLMRRQLSGFGPISFETVPKLGPGELKKLGSQYLESVQTGVPPSERIIDKMPANFTLLGLIHLALPNARIIHARRDPIDTCFSCYTQLFAGDQPHTYDLVELGRYYRAYERLMAHWHMVLPSGTILDVQYEELVGDLEGQVRRIMSHCGLAWNDACLGFYRTARPVRTASASQVRKPIYNNSIGRWRAYEAQLQPLLAALGA